MFGKVILICKTEEISIIDDRGTFKNKYYF